MTHPFLDHPKPIAFAHRGGSLEAEENTMEAFARAVEMGYSHIETDVHATRDGVVVVHHDPTLDRMTGKAMAIADLDWADLRTVRTHGGSAIPRLDDLLEAWPDLHVNIEAKSDAVADPLAEVISRTGALHRICVGSFSPGRIARLRKRLGPDLCWSPAHAGVLAIWLRSWGLPLPHGPFGALQVPVRFRGMPVVTRRFVRAALDRRLDVQVWTVDDREEMARLLDLGVHGLMTDRPTVLKDLLIERGEWSGPS
jgi:glycerophosphoryl diester phosphodiesterase